MMMSEDNTDEDAAEEAAAALATVESELGRTTDPVRMYMREMGTVELLTREGEIVIAKRIEEGINTVQSSVAEYPQAIAMILEQFDQFEADELRLSDIISGFVNPTKMTSPRPPLTSAQNYLKKSWTMKMTKKMTMTAKMKKKATKGLILKKLVKDSVNSEPLTKAH